MASLSPNNTSLAGRIQGLREAKAAFQALPDIVRGRMLAATETTVSEIARGAQARIKGHPSIDTGALYDHVAWSVTKTNGHGKVGIASGTTTFNVNGRKVKVKGVIVAGKGGSALKSDGAKVKRPSHYAHMVEFGTRHMSAAPFMIPSAEAEKDPYLERCRNAGRSIETDVAAIGMRNL